MFKQILNNQKGMSLIEVIVASVISIIIAMGVVKINETSQQGFKSIELKSELSGVSNKIQGLLMSEDKCMASDGSGNTLSDLVLAPYAGLSTDGIYPPANAAFTRYRSVADLTIVTGPGPDSSYATSGDNTKIRLTNGTKIPGASNWEINGAMRVYPNNNDGSRVCYLMVPAVKSGGASKASVGGESKNLWYELGCEIDFTGTNKLNGCNSTTTVADGLLQDNDNGSWGTGENLVLPAYVQVGGAYNDLSPVDGNPDGTEKLRVVGDTPWVTQPSYNHAIALPDNNVISFGSADNAGIAWRGGGTDLLDLISTGGILAQATGNALVTSSTGYVSIQGTTKSELKSVGDVVVAADGLVSITSGGSDVNITASGNIDLNPGVGNAVRTNGLLYAGAGIRAETNDGAGNAIQVGNGFRLYVTGGSNVEVDGGGGYRLTGGGNIDIQGGGGIALGGGGNFDIIGGGNITMDGGNFTMAAPGNIITGGNITATGTINAGSHINSGTGATVRSGNFSFQSGGQISSSVTGTTISSDKPFYAPELLAPNHYATNYYYFSDERFKKEIETVQDASEKLSQLRGVTYFLRKDEFPEKHFDEDKQIGLIAQEVELIFPELVHTAESGYKSVKYGNLVAILIEGFKDNLAEIKKNREMLKVMQEGIAKKDKEQDSRLEALEKENKALRLEVDELKNDLKSIHEKLNKLMMNKED